MRVLLRSTAIAITLAAFVAISSSTSLAQESKKEPTGSVSGRVTLGDKAVPRAVVMLTTSERGFQRTPPARATTDEDGRYRLTGVPAGSYTIAPFTPAFVVPAETSYAQPGKTITLSEGEEVDGIDFSLTRGSVITGRVTDADGRILIEQRVNIIRVDERGQRLPSSYFNRFGFGTDDRGVYRLYGLAPGRYKVSVGDSPDSGTVRIGFGGGVYTRTFHPDVLEESKAAVIEASAGSEATNVDIKLARASNTYAATGRVLDADSGKCCWVYETKAETWGGILVADGKLYFGTKKEFFVMAAGKEPRVLSRVRLGSPVYSTPIAANGVLYVASQQYLWAVQGRREKE